MDHAEKTKIYEIAILWLTIFFFAVGVWLETGRPGIAMMSGAALSCINMFADWITGLFEVRYLTGGADAETTET